MPTTSSSASGSARGARRAPHDRRAANLSTLSTTTHASDSFSRPHASFSAASTASARSPAHGGGSGASSHETTSLLHNLHVLSGDAGPSTIYEEDDAQFFELQLFAYRMIYVFQGAFLGLLGPSLSYFSKLASDKAGLNSPVSSFGPIFAAHGGGALAMSFMSELVLNVAIEMEIVKNLIVGLLVCAGAWYGGLPPVAAATGNLGVSIYFIAKGFWTALINISLNRCVLWVAARDRQRAAMGESIKLGRELVTSMNFSYGFGMVLGPVIACVLNEFNIELCYAYYGLGIAQVIPAIIIAMMPSPKPLHGRDQNQTLLGFEDPTRRVPTVPSPIVGGVFLHPRHVVKSANCNPDTYDSLNNLIILLVTINATVLFGIQLGLAAFLFDYIGHVLSVPPHALAHEAIFVWGCLLMTLFWGSLWLSYLFFSNYRFHENNMYSICVLSVVCLMSSFGILFGGEAGFGTFVMCLVVFAFALAPLFTLSIHCLTTVINELLIRRVSSLIVFGCGMGEVFIPVTMGFFMGNYSGQTYGSVAVSYILFMLSICLVGTSSMLLMMVKRKVDEVRASRGDGGMSVTRIGGAGGHHKRGSTSSYQRGG